MAKREKMSWYGTIVFDVCHNVLVLPERIIIKLELLLSSLLQDVEWLIVLQASCQREFLLDGTLYDITLYLIST